MDVFINARTQDEAIEEALHSLDFDAPWTTTTAINYGPPRGPEGVVNENR